MAKECTLLYQDATSKTLYQEVEYIQSSGTQYIDTGATLNNNSKIELKMQLYDLTYQGVSGVRVFGYRNSASSNNISIQANVNRPSPLAACQIVLDFNNSDYSQYRYAFDGDIDTTTIFTIVLDKNNRLINGTGNSKLCNDTINTSNAFIFDVNGNPYGTSGVKAKLYSYRHWNNNDYIRDMIPVKAVSSNTYGMFDKVNNKFYGNAGTGAFTGGSIVYKLSNGTKKTNIIKNGTKTALKITM